MALHIPNWQYPSTLAHSFSRLLCKSIMEVDSYTGERFSCARCPTPYN